VQNSNSDRSSLLQESVSRDYQRVDVSTRERASYVESINADELTGKSAATIKQEADKKAADEAKAAADAATKKAAEQKQSSDATSDDSDSSTDYKMNDTSDLTLTAADVAKSWSGVVPPTGFNTSHATGDIGNAYSFSQCTWWAYVRRHQLGLPAGSHMGDGAMWADTARSLGYWVDNNPHIGDVMVFQRGQEGASSTYGHVAIVEKVNTDGSVTTSESGASLNGGTISRTFTNVHDFQYIHF
jgi:surface antigen